MALFPIHMRHFVAQAFGIASLGLAVLALAGTLYALGFAVIGIFVKRGKARREQGKGPATPDDTLSPVTRFLVIIPAHNESSGLTATVQSVLRQNYHLLHCIVVADNCTDDTAEMAAAAGAHDVLIRTDPEKRGKGYALTWAFGLTEPLPWDAVCVIDADSVVEPGFFAAMDASSRQGHLAVQSRYDFSPAADNKDWLQQFSDVTKAGENSFIYRARETLGLPQLLMGNGFFLARTTLQRVPWLAHSIVEDAEYALLLERHGIPVHYQEKARLWSRQASTLRDVHPQRVRWASGVWQLFQHAIPLLLASAWRDRSWRPLEQAVMLMTISRTVLIYLLVISFLLSLAAPSFFLFTGSLILGVALLQFIYLALMFRFACDRPVPIRGLLLLPYYIVVLASAQVLALAGFDRHIWRRTTR